MRILLVSHSFPPALEPQSIQSSRIAKYLARLGHIVAVVFNSDMIIYNSTHRDDRELAADLPGVELVPVPDVQQKGSWCSFLGKVAYNEHYRYWVRKALRVVLSPRGGVPFDVVYSLAAPTASNILGMMVKERTGIPWVAHFSDPGYLCHDIRFKSPLKTYIAYSMERAIFEKADGLTFVNEDTLLKSTEACPDLREKCLVLPHSFDPDYFDGPAVVPNDGMVRFTYVGSLYARRKPFDVIRALRAALPEGGGTVPRIELNLYGSVAPEIRREIEEQDLPWVRMRGPVSYRDSIRVMRECDYLLLIDMPDAANLYTPSKLIDYLPAEKPILGVTSENSNSARLLREIGYPVTAPGDIDGLTLLFSRLLSADPLGISESHRVMAERFRADRVVTTLVDFLERCRMGRQVDGANTLPRTARGCPLGGARGTSSS